MKRMKVELTIEDPEFYTATHATRTYTQLKEGRMSIRLPGAGLGRPSDMLRQQKNKK
jgi:hypothetical protein